MTTVVDHLIVGAGTAGATAAKYLSEANAGSTMLVGAENTPPYRRPRLSKEFLRGEHTREEMLVDSAEGWAHRGVEMALGVPIVHLDTERRRARFADGREVSYGTALLATGSRARSLPVPGVAGDRVHILRTIADAEAIRAQITPGSRVVVVGGSFNGCETAASAAALGAHVTLIALEAVPLERILGSYVGKRIAELMERHGCDFIGEASAERLEVDDTGRGRVIMTDRREVRFDVLVACVGASPDLELARASQLELSDGGVACDRHLRTSAEHVYAAGDIAAYDSVALGRRIRHERFESAWSQSRTAAANMLGRNIVHDDRTPFFHSELDDWFRLRFFGLNLSWDRQLLLGEQSSGTYSVWYLKGDALAGAAFIGDPSPHEQTAVRVLRREIPLAEALAAQPSLGEILTTQR